MLLRTLCFQCTTSALMKLLKNSSDEFTADRELLPLMDAEDKVLPHSLPISHFLWRCSLWLYNHPFSLMDLFSFGSFT